MIQKNYKKIAILNVKQHIDVNTSVYRATKVNLNLTFQPSMIFVIFENSANLVFQDIMSSKQHFSQTNRFSRSTLMMYITSVTKNGFNFNAKSDDNDWVEIEQIVAIE